MIYRKLFMFLCVLIFQDIYAVKLPDFIKKCNVNDPEVSKCIHDQAETVAKIMVNGVKEINLPSLNPLHLDKVVIEATQNLNVQLTNLNVYGMDDVKFPTILFEPKKSRGNMTLFFPKITIKSDYDINGQVLIMQIRGNGFSQTELYNLTIGVFYTYGLKPDKKGIKWVEIHEFKLTSDLDKMHFNMENLFGGNKVLGDQINYFINENWREFALDIKPALLKTVTEIINGMLQGIGKYFSWDELFDE